MPFSVIVHQQRMNWWIGLTLSYVFFFSDAPSFAQEGNPLDPADTSSPQATLQSFIENINQMYKLILDEEMVDDPKTLDKKAKEERDLKNLAYQRRAVSCLDLSKIDPEVVKQVARKRAILLSEILDRITLPDPKTVPDAARVKQDNITQWTVPHTEIVIALVEEGPNKGQFLFSPYTVERLPEFYQRIKHVDYKPQTVLKNAYIKLTTTDAVTTRKESPLKPADTSSPQTTLKSFIDNMKSIQQVFKEEGRFTYGQRAKSRGQTIRAMSCMDLSKIAPNARIEIGKEKMILLMEILDRIELPPYEQIPSAKDMEKEKESSWTIPGTEIEIARLEKGTQMGEFVFTSETVARADEFYERVKHLPYKPGTVLENSYQYFLNEPGALIPSAWIQNLPGWLKAPIYDQPVWKWFVCGLSLLLLFAILVFVYRFGSRVSEDAPPLAFWRRALFPICGIVLPLLLGPFISNAIRVSGDALPIIKSLLTIVVFFSLAWLVVMICNTIANLIINSPRIRTHSINAHMIRMVFRIISLIGLVVILLWATNDLGIPLTPVLAGLGVGGVAIALASQNSLENLLGGFNLFFDRPVQVGDFCRFGDKIGTVEEIGLRSTRVRTLDRTVVCIPNSSFSKLELENYTKRDKIWYHPQIPIRAETTPDQIRYILVEAHKLLLSHPMVLPSPSRIRFAGFGENSIHLDVFAYVNVTDYGAYLEIAEDLNLRILEIISEAGSGLAMRPELGYMEGLDPNRAREAANRVDEWRRQNTLYLPDFPEDKVDELRGSIEYPPAGSPLAQPKNTNDDAEAKSENQT